MKRIEPHNVDKQIVDGYPHDWDQDIPYRGFAKRPGQKCYAITISVGGLQHYVTTAYDQKLAARLYDLVLWKVLPKMDRAAKPNFPDSFHELSQAVIDSDLPKANEIYERVPYLSAIDEEVVLVEGAEGEERLRARNLNRVNTQARLSKEVREYRDFVRSLRRYDVTVCELLRKLRESSEELPTVRRKMPAQWDGITKVIAGFDTQRELMFTLTGELERTGSYHEKVVALPFEVDND